MVEELGEVVVEDARSVLGLGLLRIGSIDGAKGGLGLGFWCDLVGAFWGR